MREVEGGDEQANALALYPLPVQVISYDPGHKVFAGARPAMEGEGERLVGLWVVNKALDGLQHHTLNQVLAVELQLQISGQACRGRA